MKYFPVEPYETVKIGHFVSSDVRYHNNTIEQKYQTTQVDLERPETGRPITAKITCSYCQEEVKIMLRSRLNMNFGRLGWIVSFFLFSILLFIKQLGFLQTHSGTIRLLLWLTIAFFIISLFSIRNDNTFRNEKDPHSKFVPDKK